MIFLQEFVLLRYQQNHFRVLFRRYKIKIRPNGHSFTYFHVHNGATTQSYHQEAWTGKRENLKKIIS